MVNNPCAVAIHEAKQLWPNSPIQCVVSFGTGRTPFFISQGDSEEKEVSNASSWKDKFYKILDSATDTEGIYLILLAVMLIVFYINFIYEFLNVCNILLLHFSSGPYHVE